MVHGKQIELVSKNAEREFKKAMSKNSKNTKRKSLSNLDKDERDDLGNIIGSTNDFKAKIKPSILALYYYEELDILVVGSEDCKIYIYGYNEEGLDKSTSGLSQAKADSVSNRVAGTTLRYTLKEHKEPVSSVVCFFKDGTHWLLSTGWDRRICLWDVKEGKLVDIFRQAVPRFNQNLSEGSMAKLNTNVKSLSSSLLFPGGSAAEELCADDIVLGIEYAPERGEYCYCSADKQAYVRKFSSNGSEMTLQVVLQGHEGDVTAVKWHAMNQNWITASEDRTIRIWPANGIPCLRIFNNDSPVTALCIDTLNGCIISGGEDHTIRVFDPSKTDEVVQKNYGHTDQVSSIVHVAVRNQYVSTSWDNTVRFWNGIDSF
jgi:WD40 repeat protein